LKLAHEPAQTLRCIHRFKVPRILFVRTILKLRWIKGSTGLPAASWHAKQASDAAASRDGGERTALLARCLGGSVREVGWATWAEELSSRPSRVLVTGTSGSGKSTLARRVAAALDAPYTELDALHHGPAWTPRPDFLDAVTRLSAAERWTTEWQYQLARPILVSRTDLPIFLDLPRWLVMTRVVRRTLGRRLGRIELWNGNFEPPLRTVFRDRDHIVRWAWRTHHEQLGRVIELVDQRPDLQVVRLQTARQVDQWVAGPLARAAQTDPRRGSGPQSSA
jgi:adenylate kinase family enzyme